MEVAPAIAGLTFVLVGYVVLAGLLPRQVAVLVVAGSTLFVLTAAGLFAGYFLLYPGG